MKASAAVGSAGLAYDLLVRTRELPAARVLVGAQPDMRFVVDHLAKPEIRNGNDDAWTEAVGLFRGLPNVWWKFSGLVTEADWKAWRPADLPPFVDRVLEIAGPDRLLFGSDWPVCPLAARYDVVLATARNLTATLSPSEQAAILGATAVAVYGLEVDTSRRAH